MHALEKVIVYYNHCKNNDIYKSVIENILKNLDKIKNANIYDLAELCYTSPTTISRLSRKMGYDGFAGFKMSLVNCVRNYDGFNHFVPYSMRGSLEKSSQGYFSLLRGLVDEIERGLDMELVKLVNERLHKSQKVYFYTCGNESVERHFQELLIISGKESAIIGLPQLQVENLKRVDSATTILFLAPVINESGDMGESIRAAREAGASVVLISDAKYDIYEKCADIYLGFDGTLCAIDDQAFAMILTILFMDYRSTYLDGLKESIDTAKALDCKTLIAQAGWEFESFQKEITREQHRRALLDTMRKAAEMVEAAKKADVKLALGHQRWFGSAVQYIRQMVNKGELGEIYYAKAMDARRRGVPTWGVYMSKAKNGGGILYDGAPHALDLAMYMMNNFRPVAVQGKAMNKMRYEVDGNPWGKWDPEQCDVEDIGFALITMENGATIFLEAAWAINMLGINNSALICGTKGGADLQGLNGGARINTIVNDKMVTFSPEYPDMPNTEPYIGEAEASDAQMKDWVEAILEDREPFVQGRDGIPAVQIIEAIFESSRTGETVKITEHYC